MFETNQYVYKALAAAGSLSLLFEVIKTPPMNQPTMEEEEEEEFSEFDVVEVEMDGLQDFSRQQNTFTNRTNSICFWG